MDYNKLGYHGKYQQQGETIGFIHQQVKDPRATCWLVGASTVGHIFFSASQVFVHLIQIRMIPVANYIDPKNRQGKWSIALEGWS